MDCWRKWCPEITQAFSTDSINFSFSVTIIIKQLVQNHEHRKLILVQFTYRMYFLKSYKQTLVSSVDLIWVLSRLENDMIVMVFLIVQHAFACQRKTTTIWRTRWKTALNRSIWFSDFLETLRMTILRTIWKWNKILSLLNLKERSTYLNLS